MGVTPGFRRRLGRTLALAPLLVAGPVLAAGGLLSHAEPILYDFRGGLYDAGRAILHGHAVYQPAFLAHQVALMRSGHIALGELPTNSFSIPVYPAFANLLAVPFALMPFWLAGLIFTALMAAAMVAGLRLLGVRDRRCLGLALVSWPFCFGLILGAVGPLLVLGAGVAWRWRDRLWPPALAVATVVAVKVFPWTLGVWLLVTRRRRALALSVVGGAALVLGAWAVLGFAGLAQYPRMLSDLTLLEEGRGAGPATVLVIAGVAPGAASAIVVVLAGVVLGAAWRLGRVGGDLPERQAFGLAVLAALLATPIVWEHYMVLLFVPLALASPQLSRLWLVPLASPILVALSRLIAPDSPVVSPHSPNALRQALIWLALEAIVGGALCTTPAQRSTWRERLRLRPQPA